MYINMYMYKPDVTEVLINLGICNYTWILTSSSDVHWSLGKRAFFNDRSKALFSRNNLRSLSSCGSLRIASETTGSSSMYKSSLRRPTCTCTCMCTLYTVHTHTMYNHVYSRAHNWRYRQAIEHSTQKWTQAPLSKILHTMRCTLHVHIQLHTYTVHVSIQAKQGKRSHSLNFKKRVELPRAGFEPAISSLHLCMAGVLTTKPPRQFSLL